MKRGEHAYLHATRQTCLFFSHRPKRVLAASPHSAARIIGGEHKHSQQCTKQPKAERGLAAEVVKHTAINSRERGKHTQYTKMPYPRLLNGEVKVPSSPRSSPKPRGRATAKFLARMLDDTPPHKQLFSASPELSSRCEDGPNNAAASNVTYKMSHRASVFGARHPVFFFTRFQLSPRAHACETSPPPTYLPAHTLAAWRARARRS